LGGLGAHNPVNQPNGGRNAFQGGARPGNLPNANRSAMPVNPGNPQAFRGVSPRGEASRSFPAPQSRPMQPTPRNSFGGGAPRGFGGGGHNFGGGHGGGGGHGHR
jgi:hypothetical protein